MIKKSIPDFISTHTCYLTKKKEINLYERDSVPNKMEKGGNKPSAKFSFLHLMKKNFYSFSPIEMTKMSLRQITAGDERGMG